MFKQPTQLSLINRATHSCKCNGVADRLKTSRLPLCVTTSNLIVSFKGCVHK